MAMQLEADRARADSAELALLKTLAEIAGLRDRPPPGLGDLAAHSARVHRDAGVTADELLRAAAGRGSHVIREAEAEAGRILRKAEHEAFDRELAARGVLDDADAWRVNLLAETRREADLLAARAAREAELVIAEAREAAMMVLAEAARRRKALLDELGELESIRRELGGSVASFHRRLGRAISRFAPVEADPAVVSGEARQDPFAQPAAGPVADSTGHQPTEVPRPPAPDLAHATN